MRKPMMLLLCGMAALLVIMSILLAIVSLRIGMATDEARLAQLRTQ